MIATVVATVFFYRLKVRTRTFKVTTNKYNFLTINPEKHHKPLQRCKTDIINNLVESSLWEIQKERKSRIREVCEMCRRNGSAMECNHLTMNGNYHSTKIYNKIFVDDKHKVSINCKQHFCGRK